MEGNVWAQLSPHTTFAIVGISSERRRKAEIQLSPDRLRYILLWQNHNNITKGATTIYFWGEL
jgi:hypothetical protein